MEAAADRKDSVVSSDFNNTSHLSSDSVSADSNNFGRDKEKEAEDHERIALDIKAGLHPLKVFRPYISILVYARNFFGFFSFSIDSA